MRIVVASMQKPIYEREELKKRRTQFDFRSVSSFFVLGYVCSIKECSVLGKVFYLV